MVYNIGIGSTIKTATGYDTRNIKNGWQNLMTAHTNYCATVSGCWDPSTMGSTCPAGAYNGAPNDPLLVTIPVGDTSGCTGSCTFTVSGFVEVYLTGLTQGSCTVKDPCWNLTGCFVKADTPGGGGSASAPQLGSIPPPNLIQ